VKVVCNGKHQIVSLTIDPQVIDPSDPEILGDMIKAAVNEAMQKLDDRSKATMQKVAGGMSIPGL
jgi:DNA-binding YbaB/EbfC family protein